MAGTPYALGHAARRPGVGVTALLWAWVERSRMRRDLGRMDDRALRDIDVSRDELDREIEKPFWRA